MITTLLVANRGEIARRVLRTCRTLGISTVAVHSDADAGAPHVREADAAVHLPGTAPADTYLRSDLLIAAALGAGADAIHPGYGFLSENAAFARAVLDAGLTWVGPPPEAVEQMGSKIESKRLMADAGVPVLAELDPASITAADLPVLVKASAGGGGRGMRVVRSLDELASQMEGARSEAASAFGDGTVFCEPYLATGRHIEVQVMCDAHGTVWAVGERECSIQRRHQKIVEESPSPLVERVPGMRDELFAAARNAAKAIGYVGAGTVEFLADDDGRFYFLEMNTRLQVEHPVTECVTGLDLVGLQVGVAEGRPLPAGPPPSQGHAIEVRLYAEDPAADWRPHSGTLHRFEVPGVATEFSVPLGTGIRLDSGVVSGDVVSPHYDPMLAKVISLAPTRDVAARALAAALTRAKAHGVTTNRDLLVRVLTHPAFLAGDTDTAFFDRHGLDTLAAPLAAEETVQLSALAAALSAAAANRASARVQGRIPSGWRNVVAQPQRKRFTVGGTEHEVRYRLTRDGLDAEGLAGVRLVEVTPDTVVLDVTGLRRRFAVSSYPGLSCVDSPLGSVSLVPVERFADPATQVAAGSLLAPMPGTVVRVAAAVGDRVTSGQPLLWLEAMKMQHQVNAPADGVLTELGVAAGDQVEVGRVLAVVSREES
ncbi:MAG: ATP-grasp domain-containing protein [Actinophytocola sp.]|uniref:ATP-binding protein n=1 Tax=Actinophytocola sp. TaxID=1872138 RepID=UPI00132735CC|nr:biotin carboxylase N-terminal domain-containing protein [Actinophytocola sp.]MPZ84381.1 ATP-grasp domain-containing protein [Actinophytocola sp.]